MNIWKINYIKRPKKDNIKKDSRPMKRTDKDFQDEYFAKWKYEAMDNDHTNREEWQDQELIRWQNE